LLAATALAAEPIAFSWAESTVVGVTNVDSGGDPGRHSQECRVAGPEAPWSGSAPFTGGCR